jgi:hypothetical protein
VEISSKQERQLSQRGAAQAREALSGEALAAGPGDGAVGEAQGLGDGGGVPEGGAGVVPLIKGGERLGMKLV